MKRGLVLLAVLGLGGVTYGQPARVLLWPNGAPQQTEAAGPDRVRITEQGEHVVTHVIAPSITPYLPAAGTGTGTAVVIAPGGGHSELWMDHEGYRVAEVLSRHGIAAFVLEYRLAKEAGSVFTVEGTELGDMQRAIRVVRSRAAEWGVNPARVGVMGFSAGGELALLASVSDGSGAGEGVDGLSARPDFEGLIYPGLHAGEIAGLVEDKRLNGSTPPAFLACGAEDQPAISQGVAELYLAMARLHVAAEMHIYARTGHGFGVRATNTEAVTAWPELFVLWVRGLFST